MQLFFNLVYYFTYVPKIIVGIVLLYIIFKVVHAFYYKILIAEDGLTFGNIYNFIDPYHQSPFFYKYNFFLVFILISIILFLCYIYIPPEMIEDGKYLKHSLLNNYIADLPNYLVHEFSHRFWAVLGWDWWTWACGSFVEILFPCTIYLFSLQLRGAQFFSPILFYWIATALYDTGVYASDAVVSKLALTSSNMVSNFKVGEMKGDWYYILKPLGLLDYAEKIGLVLEVLSCIFIAFAIYGIINYFIKLGEEPLFKDNN